MVNVNHSINTEKIIKKQLITTPEIKHRIDIGQEYFEGDITIIKKQFMINCYEIFNQQSTTQLNGKMKTKPIQIKKYENNLQEKTI